ncbi:MAG: zinc-ribbon domain-containing protein [Xanthomonadaceae bacterium]|nr:zinc-ribbon domain-containing protein [Xanthomonadaceae bacterium]
MYTQCPRCRTIFEIGEDALQASLGIVRCGHCSERFDALRTLSDTLPDEPEAALPEHDPDALAPTLTSAVSPETVQAAAYPARKPGSETGPAQPDEAWFDTLSGDRARALIADAAGIPPEAIQSDPAWQLTDLPVQTRFAELDIIPMAAAEPDPHAPAPIVAAGSEPFTEVWGLDIPDVDPTGPAANVPAMSEAAGLSTADDAPAELADDTGAAVPPAAAETEFDPDSWQPEEQLRAGDTLPPDATGTEEKGPVPTGAQHEFHDGDAEPASVAEPVYVPPRRGIRRGDWLWATGCVVLALALAAQIAWASRVALVRDPATQVQALRVCARLDCRLPPIRDTAKLELLSRDIRPDPDAAGALAITATFRNNAPYRQPWPIVVVDLTDLDNNVVAMRRFRPAEYMPDAARRAAGIAAGTTAAVAFEVADPGKRAVSFHFGFE